MSRTPNDTITWSMMLRKLPSIAKAIPRVVKGMKAANVKDPTQPCGLGWSFEQATLRNPDAPALLQGEVALAYAQVNQWANRIAHHLIAQGIRKGDVVAVFIENRPELLVTILAVAKVGAISALLNTSQTRDTLAHSLNLVAPAAIIVGEELVPAFSAVRERVSIEAAHIWFIADRDTFSHPGIAPDGFINLMTASADSSSANPASSQQVFFDDPCFYIYTSGTTGLPKAGVFKHGRWMRSSASFGLIALNMRPEDVVYCTLPLYHATGLCVCWGSAISGASGFAIRRKFSASQFWNDVRKYRATTLGYVGELCRYLVDQPPSADDSQHGVTKMIGNGLRPGAWGEFKTRFGVNHICELYAASDGNIGFTNILNFDNTVGFSLMSWELTAYDHDSGAPIRDASGYMRKVAKGEQGLLLAKIDDKAPLDGYTDPQKTEKVVLHDVFKKGDRYFNTGDLLRNIGFGHAQFVDRLGDTFRWKGENVSTTEVENLLLQHPHISEAVAYGVEIRNTNGRAGMAAITPAESLATLDFSELLAFAREQMPAYAVPLFLRVKVKMETTGTFKYQKTRLKDEAFDPGKTGDDPIYAWLPGTQTYVQVTPQLLADIHGGAFRY
ncbi:MULTISPECIES: long-chain-acyl-CoA synthetase [unclassified Pseudomonas]|uniref:long-chain-acyl-CoA synthetase n=1 Tax=unclassified Pseudomonas TaxID=196821 RepID=UPI000C87D148|nr:MULTISPECIES: long-chain-acyl-CoA synthetase [unclassified Pseudomonas]PMU11062.1 long-chain-acyl-CoA synthetase [Pseudomonas sp. FW305-20]PMU17951.1 long-chain-acyl-CoA synthetase [Pseudomonas sp. FW305-122]PMU39064.1 long-chain-acyl-CoA synthetase [Pseudomonas sp. FW305-47B]PMX59568.1 long-chain-acyl-CoA synthetase [Pseudomonas sp. FW305-33]PMX70222.1 long-chain-acyl-CoA synthetase [Pseudomonas sp. FW305-60]